MTRLTFLADSGNGCACARAARRRCVGESQALVLTRPTRPAAFGAHGQRRREMGVEPFRGGRAEAAGPASKTFEGH